MRRHSALITVIFVLLGVSVSAFGKSYSLDLTHPDKEIFRGHLKMGGNNPQGDTISFTNYYMEVNGRPVLPVMGEFQYSRYPECYWEEAILKIKAGGVDIIPTYVFWSHHEEEEGIFDWSGNKNLRRFVELCAKNKVWTIVRIGPYCHGEVRNGALPDWLYGRPFRVRSNDEGYLYYVRRHYNQIGRQLEGLMFEDGGPIIGIQLENEYQHSSSPWELTYKEQPMERTLSSDDPEHMKMLKKLALDAGLVAPIYTATGWGGGVIIEDETLPVTSAYPWPFWTDLEPSVLFLFKDIHKNPDYPPAKYVTERYPSFCAEMGGGMVTTYNRRPIVPAEGLEALVTRSLGSGANGIGYYMYHGGSNPIGRHNFMNEHVCPKISYDFQAPLGDFGQVRDSYRFLKILHLFLNEFGPILAPMVTVLPEGAEQIVPTDVNTLRYAGRVKGNCGFVFLINFQDHVECRDIEDIKLNLKLDKETISIPQENGFTLRKNTSVILPFNLSLNGVLVKYATAQALTKIENPAPDGSDIAHYFFYAPEGIRPEYALDRSTVRDIEIKDGKAVNDKDHIYITAQPGSGSLIKITGADGSKVSITTLTRRQALNCFKTTLWGKERLILSEALVLDRDEFIQLQQVGSPQMSLSIYPDVEGGLATSTGNIQQSEDGIFASYKITVPEKEIQLNVKPVGKDKAVVEMAPDAMEGLNDIFLKIDYVGDTGMAFIDGRLSTDNFYYGSPWWISLKQFVPDMLDKGMYFYFKPMYESAKYLIDLPAETIPDFSQGPVIELRSIEAIPQYQIVISRKQL
jgi:hypothetical protein